MFEFPLSREVLREISSLGSLGTALPLRSAGGWEAVVPSAGGLTKREAIAEEERAWDLAESLWSKLESHERCPTWRQDGERQLAAVAAAIDYEPMRAPPLAYRQSSDLAAIARAGQVLSWIVDWTYLRFLHTFQDEQVRHFGPPEPIRSAVEPHRDALRRLALSSLNGVGAPVDDWHQATALAYLLCPDLALCAVTNPFWHPPPPAEQGHREVQVATAVGALNATERTAEKAKAHYRKNVGVVPVRKKTGPKPGSRNRPSEARSQLESYVRARADIGVSPQMIAEDARANALFRIAADDPAKELNEAIVRDILRKRR